MKSPKDVLALGQAIVRQLELDERGEVLERWLAHHLAELISEADHAAGLEKAAAERQAIDLILKLWMHRRALPEPVDPMGGYRNAISVLGRLMPEADPWRRYRKNGSYEDLLHETFQILCRIVLGGILLTQATRTRSISEVESKALAEEEVFLREELERWLTFVTLPPQRPEVEIELVGSDAAEEAEAQEDSSEDSQGDLKGEQQAVPTQASIHSAIVANLELMQTDLASLLARWTNSAPKESEPDEVRVVDEGLGD